MWSRLRISFLKIVLLLSLVFVFCCSSAGYTKTTTEMTESITIPMQTWQALTEECKTLNQDLIACQTELTRLKRPSAELLNELSEAEKTLKLLQTELEKQKADLTMLSKEVEESRTSLKKLRENIDKERRIHKRQIWQNRIWCLIIGAGIGALASR